MRALSVVQAAISLIAALERGVSALLLSMLLHKHPSLEDARKDNERCEANKVDVEGFGEAVEAEFAVMHIVLKLFLIWEAAHVRADASSHGIRADERGDEDANVVLAEAAEQEEREGAAENGSPVHPVVIGAHNCYNNVTNECTGDEAHDHDSILLKLVEGCANEDTSNNPGRENDPENRVWWSPIPIGETVEGKNGSNQESRDSGHREDGKAKHSSSKEAHETAHDYEDSSD